jgi:serine protease Do
VAIQPVTDELASTLDMDDARGSIVSEVTVGGPADRAGLQAGDVILGLDGKEIAETQDLIEAISGRAPSQTASLRILRDGEERDVEVELGRFPEPGAETASAASSRTVAGMTLGELTPALAGRLGIEPGTAGALVSDVELGTAADRAGLRPGDVVVAAGGEPVDGPADLSSRVGSASPGELFRLRVLRGGAYTFLVLRVG